MFNLVNGKWIKKSEDGKEFLFEEFPIAFYPILETSFSDSIKKSPHLQEFPFLELITSASRSDSQYWQEMALKRIVDAKNLFQYGSVCRQLLLNGITQKIRHESKRILKIIEKERRE